MQEFCHIRESAFKNWQDLTGRQCHDFYDDINEAFECDWQGKSQKHVSIFCSLGVWGECLSQLLQDKRYDNIDISEKRGSEDLYSYYNQFLLITSEILDDLVNMYMTASDSNDKKSARSCLSTTNGYKLHPLIGFINNIVKHKSKNFHICNHHIPILLEDDGNKRKSKTRISVGNIGDLETKKALMMPSLVKIVYSVAGAYGNLDEYFKQNNQNYLRVATKYQELA